MLKAVVVSTPAGLLSYLVSDVDFSNTVNTGALILSLLVVVTAGIFTIRANTAKIWRENYEGEKIHREEVEAELQEQKNQILKEREEQQQLRHELKNEIAALKLKTDLTGHEANAEVRTDRLLATITQGFEAQRAVLQGILEVLSKQSKS